MIIEGQWWENEIKESAKKFGTHYNFGWMPLPRPSKEYNHPNVYIDTMDCVSLVKKGTSKKALATDFIQYVDSKNGLLEFTKTTNAVKGLDYKLTDDEKTETMESLTNFGKSVFKYKQNADFMLSDTQNVQFVKNLYSVNAYRRYKTTFGDMPISNFLKNYNSSGKGQSPEDWFGGMYAFYSNPNNWQK